MKNNRDITIDILRGAAIFTMIAANMAGEFLIEPHPLWLRAYGSFAAPVFILISGMMVSLTSQRKDNKIKHFLLRGSLILIVAAFIDTVIWKIYPFIDVDVLYIIGISLPIVYALRKFNLKMQYIFCFIIFLLTPIIQNLLGYRVSLYSVILSNRKGFLDLSLIGIFKRWIIDGWFPLFPWLGFSLGGLIAGKLRWDKKKLINSIKIINNFVIGISILIIGVTIWYFYPSTLFTREGYSELFYPPTFGYIITSIGLMFILFFIVDRNPKLIIYHPLKALGEAALFFYIFHIITIALLMTYKIQKLTLLIFMFLYFIVSFLLILIAYSLRFLKRKWINRPYIIKFLLGN